MWEILIVFCYALLNIFSAQTFNSRGSPDIVGISTVFGQKNDKWSGTYLACSPKEKVKISFAAGQHVCAHRTLPCGAILLLENPKNHSRSWCKVLDRGPYGAIMTDGSWAMKLSKEEEGTWRGVLDLSPSVARELGHTGYQKVKAWRLTKSQFKMINVLKRMMHVMYNS